MRWHPILAAAALLGAGCDATDSEPAPSGPAAPTSPSPAEVAPAAERALVEMPVRWPARDTIDHEALALLSPGAADAVAKAPLPALVPNRPELLTAATVMTKPNWYAVSTRHDGITVSLHASRVAHRYAHIQPVKGARAVRGGNGWVGQNQGIWSVSWREHGVAYALDLECASHADSRCQDEAAVVELTEKLVYVGGVGAEVTP